jgi:hypothetical protein
MTFSNASSVTLVLLIAFGAFVMFTVLKNWFDSNLPLIFYIVFFSYMNVVEGAVPFWLICTACGLALILRFEFMNPAFQRIFKFLELGALGTMLYLAASMIVRF